MNIGRQIMNTVSQMTNMVSEMVKIVRQRVNIVRERVNIVRERVNIGRQRMNTVSQTREYCPSEGEGEFYQLEAGLFVCQFETVFPSVNGLSDSSYQKTCSSAQIPRGERVQQYVTIICYQTVQACIDF